MTIMIENLSYNTTLDQEALQAVAGSGIFSSIWGAIKKGAKYVYNNPTVLLPLVRWGFKKYF